jgi:hypothetical protein
MLEKNVAPINVSYRTYIMAVAMVISTLTGSVILGKSIENIKKERYVEVRGLAEREVRADSSLWVIPLSAANDSLSEAQVRIASDSEKVFNFLKQYNLTLDEISKRNARVIDKLAQQYIQDNANKLRYIVEEEIVVKTNKVDDLLKASQNIGTLVNDGVIISMNQGPRFFYTKLNEIKPEMIAESIRQASKAANEFAINSNSRIGKIKKATQGRFSIMSREATGAPDQYSYVTDEIGYINKTVRVVSSVEYYLRD